MRTLDSNGVQQTVDVGFSTREDRYIDSLERKAKELETLKAKVRRYQELIDGCLTPEKGEEADRLWEELKELCKGRIE